MGCGDWARRGSWAAEQVLKRMGQPIEKALDPTDPDDFLLIAGRLARSLRGAAVGLEGDAIRSAIESLDVDWPAISEAKRDQVIAAARREVAGLAVSTAPFIEPVLERSAAGLIPLTRKVVISSLDLTLAQSATWAKSLAGDLRDSQMVYIKDQYANRAALFDGMAKDTVSSGLERGLGRDDISEELSSRLTPLGVERGTNYMNLIATDFANKTRTTSQLNTFQDAGIEQWEFDAILDEATSEICRLLHGRIFSVEKAQKRTAAALKLRDPEDIKTAMPWVQTSGSSLYFQRGNTQHDVATVETPGLGGRDKIGTYSGVMSNNALEKAGVIIPPRHGHCRSTIRALV